MKKQLLYGLGLLALNCLWLLSLHAQQKPPQFRILSNSTATTTNWLGYVVYGKDSVDTFGYGAAQEVEVQLQIGLRSDGVVVWRKAPHEQ